MYTNGLWLLYKDVFTYGKTLLSQGGPHKQTILELFLKQFGHINTVNLI
jgi:hypothetical protein